MAGARKVDVTRRILYVTFDGLLEPLGFSQVARLVMELAERGANYEVLSLEKPRDLENAHHVRTVREALSSRGIGWTFATYSAGSSSRSVADNMRVMTAAAFRRVARGGITLVHARSYHAGVVATLLRHVTRTPFLFDARSYWIDEKLDEGRWFTNPNALRVARTVERRFYRDASGVVTLTELQRDDIVHENKFGIVRVPVVAIPTCADYEVFHLREGNDDGAPRELADVVRAKRVIGLVGSTNASYRTDEMLACARAVLLRASDTHLLVLTSQQEAFETLTREAGIDASRRTILRVPHERVAGFVRHIDFALQFLVETPAKRASMPTKLAEFFASGVRPIHFGGSPEISEWVRRAGTGVVLDSLDEGAFGRVAEWAAATTFDRDALEGARERTREHFSLSSGADRYMTLLRALGATA